MLWLHFKYPLITIEDVETVGTVSDFILGGSKITADGDCSQEIKWRLLFGRKAMTNLVSIWKSRDNFASKVPSCQSFGFSSSHVWVWELDYKESWVPKNWCFWIAVLEKTLESPSDCKEIQPVNKGNQSWMFIGRTETETETTILWPPDVKDWLIAKYPDAGENWGQEEKEMTEDEKVGWHHRLDVHDSEQAPEESEGQASLACLSLWSCEELDTT